MNKLEIDMLIGIMSQMINYAIAIKPELEKNKLIEDMQAVISGLNAIGL